MNFKLWIEAQEQQADSKEQKAKQIFQQARQRLLGTTQDYSLSLNRLEGGSAEGGRNKGPAAAQRVLGPVFQQLNTLGEPFNTQANQAMNWLQSISNGDIKVNANWTVGRLLSLMFGPELYEKFTDEPAPSGDVEEPMPRDGKDVTHVPDKKSNISNSNPFQPPNQQQISQEPMGQANHANSANLSW